MKDANENKFSFLVSLRADKKVIKKHIEEKFNVHVISLSTRVMKGRTVRTGKKRIEVKQGALKKAVTQLKEGEKIGLFETK